MAGKYKIRQSLVQPTDTDYRYIALTNGQIAVVDAQDFEHLTAHLWMAWWSKWNRSYYACRSGSHGERIYMHRQILGLKKGDKREGDHGLRNTLDNRRFVDGKENLRIATRSQNQMNRPKSGRNVYGLKGVGWSTKKQRFRARINAAGKEIHLGFFHTKEAASAAYISAAEMYHGKFAANGG